MVSQTGWEVSELTFGGTFCSLKKSRSARSSYISAFWCVADGDMLEFERMCHLPRLGRLKYVLKHSLTVSNEQFEHAFRYLPVDEETRFTYGKPVEVWKSPLFQVFRSALFMPVQQIKNKLVIIECKLENRDDIAVLSRHCLHA